MQNCKILVPLDFSDAGKYALQAAQKIATLFDGSITPFHSYVPISDLYGPDMFGLETTPTTPLANPEEVENMHREHLQEFVEDKISGKLLGEPVLSIGNPAQAISETAKDFDIIVMSTHGRSGFSRFFLGSVSDKVLRMAHIPVLVVNKEKQLKSLKRIMLATDFSNHSKQAFPVAKEIASKAKATIELVHILSFDPHEKDQPDESTITLRRQRLEVLAKEELHDIDHLVETKLIISSNTPHEAILNENLNHPHDLIIMSTVGRTGIDYLMMGSTTSNVVRHVKSPVLSVNPKNKPSVREEE
jgi:nucleotide-binding universal stress UspA family protein